MTGRARVLLPAVAALAILPLVVVAGELAHRWTRGPEVRAAAAELVALSGRHPVAEFGATDVAHMGIVSARAYAAVAGATPRLDVAAWYDMANQGLRTSEEPRLNGCGTPEWILPREGEPFSWFSPIDGKAVYSEAFRADFLRRYRIIEETAHWRVWRCGAA
jgi:hypothetical protein